MRTRPLTRSSRAAAALAVTSVVAVGAATATAATTHHGPPPLVGRQSDGSILTPADQVVTPAGRQVEIPGRITGLALDPTGATAVVHAASGTPSLFVVNLATGTLTQAYRGAPDSGSFDGVAFTPDARTVVSSGAGGTVAITSVAADGSLTSSRTVTLPAQYLPPTACCNPYPGGIAVGHDGSTAYVALSRANALGVLDLHAAALTTTIAVGNAPHSVVLDGTYAYVSNEGGRPAQPTDFTNDSAGTPIVADTFTGAAITGTVSVVDLRTGTQTATIPVGLHPTALLLDGHRLFVANTSSDSVSVIDTATRKVEQTISVAPFPGAPYGSQPNGLAMLPDGRLAVSLGGDNAIAIVDCNDQPARVDGLVPTGWFPAGVAVDAARGQLVVANEKGIGSLGDADAGRTARSVGSEVATVSLIPLPTPGQLRADTAQVFADNRWDRLDRAPARPGAAAVAVPRHLGEPSLIKHVLYIVKENRTYDQLLGDIGRGNSGPAYAIFGKTVTPNTHALATMFPLLDNFYDSGRRSNDGHQWAMQADAPDYLEKGASSQRSDYQSGETPPSSGFDALLYLPSGFIWENALRHGKTFADFGEYTDEDQPPPARSDKPSLEPYVVPEYQGFNLDTPDVVRAREFTAHLQTWTAKGAMPNLVTLTLPLDHTGGNDPLYSTPQSQVADNDAGLGMIVDAVSHSPFWKDTAIFVVEDDSQGGVDHVDGHRSICLVVSPYARHGGYVDSDYQTQIDVVRTIEQILGLPPMNQMDLAAEPMYGAFTDTPDVTPYAAIAPAVPIDVPNPPVSGLHGLAREWAAYMLTQNLRVPDAVDTAILNRDIWYAVTGFTTPYPGDLRMLTPAEAARARP